MANDRFVVFESKAWSADHNSKDFTNADNIGAQFIIDCTNVAVSGSATFYVEGKAGYSQKYYTVGQSAAVAAATTVVVSLHPGLTAGTNVINNMLPQTWRVRADHSDATALTYSVEVNLID